jgi:hypothetical protein
VVKSRDATSKVSTINSVREKYLIVLKAFKSIEFVDVLPYCLFLFFLLGSLNIFYSWDHVSKISHVQAMKLKTRHLEHRFSHRETNAIFKVYDTLE